MIEKYYGLHAFAKKIGMAPGNVKTILEGQRIPGVSKIENSRGDWLIPESAIYNPAFRERPRKQRVKKALPYTAIKIIRQAFADRMNAGYYDDIPPKDRQKEAAKRFQDEIVKKCFPKYLDK